MDLYNPQQKVRVPVGPPRKSHRLDWISRLPDDNILYILSFLPMKEAGRTCTLSKRWRYLWTKLVDLDFDASGTCFHSHALVLKQDKYVDWVNQVVGICKSSPQIINTFKVHFLLDNRHTADIDNWVKFAIQKGVHNLELNLSRPPWRNALEIPCNPYVPNYLFFTPCCSSSFAGLKTQLKSITLVAVDISGPSLEFILFSCCNLEHLSVGGNQCLVSLKISNSPLTLRHLVLDNCPFLQKLQIFAENLTSITLWGRLIDAEYHNVPSLKEACFGGSYGAHLIHNYHNLSSFAPQLEKLSLCLIQMATFPIGFTTFTKIKQLELTVMSKDGDSLLFLISYLEACPLLHHFMLKVKWSEFFHLGPESEVARKAWKEATCTHNHLKVVEFVGFIGGSSDVELVLYLINKYALELEKIILDACDAIFFDLYDGDPERITRHPQSRRKAAELAKLVPSRIHVVVM